VSHWILFGVAGPLFAYCTWLRWRAIILARVLQDMADERAEHPQEGQAVYARAALATAANMLRRELRLPGVRGPREL
jgi:hypothetical protein